MQVQGCRGAEILILLVTVTPAIPAIVLLSTSTLHHLLALEPGVLLAALDGAAAASHNSRCSTCAIWSFFAFDKRHDNMTRLLSSLPAIPSHHKMTTPRGSVAANPRMTVVPELAAMSFRDHINLG